MYHEHIEIYLDDSLRRRLRITGILLCLVGLLGVLLPEFFSVTLTLLVALLLIFGGVLSAYVTWRSYPQSGLAWLKPFALVALGLILAFYPIVGTATVGLILIVYFLFDAFAGIGFALALRPFPGWGWALANGLLSLVLAIVFIAGWPFGSTWLVGLLVGLSLLLDGIALLMLGR